MTFPVVIAGAFLLGALALVLPVLRAILKALVVEEPVEEYEVTSRAGDECAQEDDEH